MDKTKGPGISEALLAGAKRSGARRSEEIKQRWTSAKKIMEEEIVQGDGIYPYNGGKIDLKEICRRAAIAQATLYTDKHKNSTLVEMQTWCNSKTARKKTEVQELVGSKVDYWKGEHEKIANSIHIYELQLEQKDNEITGLTRKIADLEEKNRDKERENAILRENLANASARNIYTFQSQRDDKK